MSSNALSRGTSGRTLRRTACASAALVTLLSNFPAVHSDAQSSSTGVIVVKGGTLIDGTGAPPRKLAAIVIRDGHFARIVPAGEAFQVPSGASVIDASGRTLVPGLWDLHVHMLGLMEGLSPAERDASVQTRLAALLASGVTGVLDTGAVTTTSVDIRRRLRSGEIAGPRYFTCGAFLTPTNGHPTPYGRVQGVVTTSAIANRLFPPADTPEQARDAVAQLAKAGVDGIKIIIEAGPPFSAEKDTTRMTLETARAAVAAATAAGLPTFAHVTSVREAKDAVTAGVRSFVHSVVEDPLDDELIASMRAKQVGYVTTVTIFEGFIEFTGRDAPWNDPVIGRLVEPRVVKFRRDPAFLARLAPLVESAKQGLPLGRANLRRAVEAGLDVALGTDVGNPFVFHGYATHREMGALVRAGLDPVRAIKVATLGGARVLRMEKQYGSVEVAKAADLLVLGADPTQDIVEAFRQVAEVIIDGRRVDLRKLPLPGNATAGSPDTRRISR